MGTIMFAHIFHSFFVCAFVRVMFWTKDFLKLKIIIYFSVPKFQD